ncbi:anthocyanidin 5,3-O-glucosyltransferase-like [Lolium rigidum]|uniref:anthocyanidin 5,3-O-glucosyltransferase-like n=1 Tax=Lolium rigidum TaxID=89674 RepID=UPI001F5D0365|nr:anthocyanidin 5,3-O-glucosyltransferase-like [Lolium rigidum]XP_047071466.1 anthocyanidin 5,3-O-glucosyltransferase-like [Lolium rigidum]XP_047071467.1 anthocyanidin 5,3-O-glucosyltransferase-like [Lolium rigidum]
MPAPKTFVLYPSLGVGHLNPMVELAKHLLRHAHTVVIAVVDPPDSDAVSADAVARLAAANPSIAFRLLPVPPSPDHAAHPVKRSLDTLRLANPVLRDLLRSLPAPGADALLLDMFCVDALDVAAELDVPAYFFFASAAGALAVLLDLPHSYPELPSSFKDMGEALVRSPGMLPIRAVDMPLMVQDKESVTTKVRLHQFRRIPEGRGVLVNSFDWLEPTALRALADGVCVPGRPTPRVYCIGPLVDGGGEERRHECLAWLDAQPRQSVVFLCFGSKGAFSAAQLKEIASGLESSGHRFLWAVRSPPEEQSEFPEPDLERLLPAGFLERTRNRGMVLGSWVPQAEVVRHEAVGAFVTHCGWNSTLEAIMSGLPLICWPLYAEQALNKVFMVEEMKIAVALEGYEKGMVEAEELEAKLRLVMETEEGRKLRDMLVVARKMALDAIGESGSSEAAFVEFLRDLENSTMESPVDRSGRVTNEL